MKGITEMTTVRSKAFGSVSGREARLFSIDNGALRAEVTDLGASLAGLYIHDEGGLSSNLVCGYDDASGYFEGTSSVGATVGRYAGRIGNARFTLDGKEYPLEKNDGENHLHGGFNKRSWEAETVENGVRFSLLSPSGDEGFPGELAVSVKYELEDRTLRLSYEAEAKAPTIVNLTNHSYFSLSGHGPVGGHILTVCADRFAGTDAALIPTGRLLPVRGTELDFTRPRILYPVLTSPFLAGTRGLDHSFILPEGEGLKHAAELYSPVTGIRLICRTTQPTVHVYTAGFLDLDASGRFPRHGGVCLETQHLPDSPNKPGFPTTVLRPGEKFGEITEYEIRKA